MKKDISYEDQMAAEEWIQMILDGCATLQEAKTELSKDAYNYLKKAVK